MAKYIIELEDEPYMREDEVNYYTCKSARWYKLGETIINRLTPYTEPDKEPTVNEAWDFVKALYGLSDEELYEIFPNGCPYEMTYSEAKAKYDAWKQKKEEVRVGDEVMYHGTKYVVFRKLLMSNVLYMEGLNSHPQTTIFSSNEVTKTGRHFDEVEKLLKKMEEA